MEKLENKIILITGAGQGLGEATARVLAEAGAKIIAADIKEESIGKLSEDLKAKGQIAMPLVLDVTNDQSIEKGVQQIIDEHKRLDVLINNAGVDVTKSIEEMSREEFDKVINVNLRAPFVLSKMAFPIMEKQGGGSIVNIASTAAKRSWANASAYHASKWGLLGMSHALYVEGRDKNIRVSAVVAGGMRTPFILERFPDTPLDVLQDPVNVAEVIKFVLMQNKGSIIPEVMVVPMKETSWP